MTKETKRCPYCGEEILAVAKKCKHCGEWLDRENVTEPAKVPVVQVNSPTSTQQKQNPHKKAWIIALSSALGALLIGISIFSVLSKPSKPSSSGITIDLTGTAFDITSVSASEVANRGVGSWTNCFVDDEVRYVRGTSVYLTNIKVNKDGTSEQLTKKGQKVAKEYYDATSFPFTSDCFKKKAKVYFNP